MWLLAVISILLTSCGKDDDPAPQPPVEDMVDTIPVQDTIRFSYLALGDSYTIGTALPDSNEAYPYQLVERLSEDSLLEGSTPDIVAFGGWRTDQLIFGIDTADLDASYSIVSLLIGVNNQFQNRPDSIYRVEFEELLQTAIQYAEGDPSNVFVLSIPDYGVTPFGAGNPNITPEIDFYNSINLEITEAYGISYFNITDISRLAANNLDLLAPDNLHPSGEMYSLWVDEIVEEVKTKLYE